MPQARCSSLAQGWARQARDQAWLLGKFSLPSIRVSWKTQIFSTWTAGMLRISQFHLHKMPFPPPTFTPCCAFHLKQLRSFCRLCW